MRCDTIHIIYSTTIVRNYILFFIFFINSDNGLQYYPNVPQNAKDQTIRYNNGIMFTATSI